jgi:enamine deaminase RidA (YjgF/YER057c/UK114 family)
MTNRPSGLKIFLVLAIGVSAASTAALFVRLGYAAGEGDNEVGLGLAMAALRLCFAGLILAPMWFRTRGDVDILFLSGSTGRDPFEDAPCRTPQEEREGKGKVVGGIKEQVRQCLEDIKNNLELMGASLENIVMFRYYLPRREDVFDMRDEMYAFFEEHETDLREHPRPATLLRGVGIDLKEMLIEIEAWAVVPRKG